MAETFVTDPLVPVELKLDGTAHFTLYQPGWHSAGEGAAAFLGRGDSIYSAGSLAELAGFVRSGAGHSLGDSPFLAGVRSWTDEEYADRLCTYDLAHPPELADDRLDEHEQYSLGSTLALMLDLLDHTGTDDEHANALRDNDEINRLAAGELLGGMSGSGKRRQVVELLSRHWAWCVAAVRRKLLQTPDVPASVAGGSRDAAEGGDPGGEPFLEDVTEAVAVWFGFAETGVYTLRTTVPHHGLPAYPGAEAAQPAEAALPAEAGRDAEASPATGAGGGRRLRGWSEPESMARDLAAGTVDELGPVTVAADVSGVEPNCRPHDDLIFDLYEVGESITPDLSPEEAAAVGEAWIELTRLAAWGGWTGVAELTAPTSTVGAYVLGCASDVARSAPGAERAAAGADTDAVREAWRVLLDAVLSRIDVAD